MNTELLGLDASATTAVTVIVTGVVIPLVTSVLKHPDLPKWARRAIPIGLAAIASVIIVLLQAGGPFAEQVITWLVIAATLVGIAQTLYTAMPSVWKSVEPNDSRSVKWYPKEGDNEHTPN